MADHTEIGDKTRKKIVYINENLEFYSSDL